MSTPSQFYLEQAAICASAAENCALANQREKYLRAQAAWNALANRELGRIAAREQREADKPAE